MDIRNYLFYAFMLALFIVITTLIIVIFRFYAEDNLPLAYKISDASVNKVVGVYKCRSISLCMHSHISKIKLVTTFVIFNGIQQKRWFIIENLENKDNYLYGSIELSPAPLVLKPWKRLGPEGGHEPSMTMITYNTSAQCENLLNFRQLDDNVDGPELFWLILSSRSNFAKYPTSNCTDLLMLKLYENFPRYSDRSQLLVYYSICESFWLSHNYVNSLQCYNKVPDKDDHSIVSRQYLLQYIEEHQYLSKAMKPFESKIPSSYRPLRPSLIDKLGRHIFSSETILIQPFDCIFGRDREESLDVCIWLTVYIRMSLEMLLKELDPIAALKIIEWLVGLLRVQTPQYLLSLLFIVSAMLGNIVSFTRDADSIYSTSNEIGNASIKVSSISSMCDILLSLRKSFSDSNSNNLDDLFHQALYKTCFQLSFPWTKRLDGDLSSSHLMSHRDILDYSVSQITNLMGLGLVEVAALNLFQATSDLMERRTNSLSPALAQLEYERIFAQIAESFRFIAFSNVELLLSDNIRAMLVLQSLLEHISSSDGALEEFFSHRDLLALFLSTALQISSPTILAMQHSQSRPHIWTSETLILRLWILSVLNTFIAQCNRESLRGFCSISDPHLTVGARGLFLIAYQGVNLLGRNETFYLSFNRNETFDFLIPYKYFQLLQITSGYLPWDYHRDESGGDGSRIRVAFLSFFLRRHSVGRLLSMIIAHLNREKFDVWIVCQSLGRSSFDSTMAGDEIHKYLKARVPSNRWVHLPEDLNTAVEKVRDLDLEIVVFGDLFMDSFSVRKTNV